MFQLENHDIGRMLKVVGPRLDDVDLDAMAKKTLETGEPVHATGKNDGMTIEISAFHIRDEDAAESEPKVVILFKKEGGRLV